MNRTRRSGRVVEYEDIDVLERMNRSKILRHWTNTAAQYPTPTPLEDIWVESCNSGEIEMDLKSSNGDAIPPNMGPGSALLLC